MFSGSCVRGTNVVCHTYLVYKSPCRETCPLGLLSCAIQIVPSKLDWIPLVPIVHNTVLDLD